jgi:Golgi casein kinase Fam20
VRLGTCIALEIVTGLVALGGASMGTAWGVAALRGDPTPSHAKPPIASHVPVPVPVPVPDREPKAPAQAPDALAIAREQSPAPVADRVDPPVAVADPAPAAAVADPVVGGPVDIKWQFAGQADEPLLAPLRTGKLVKVKFNRGGTSLSLRLDFDNGARAAFKPEQIFLHSNPRREIAAYRIDRLLGIGRVPPAIGRTFTVNELVAAVDQSQKFAAHRLHDEMIARRGVTKGEMSWWIPVLGDMYIGHNRIDSTDAIVQWRKWLKAGAEIPADRYALCEQLSAMALFDFLIDNTDRWSGNNARASEDGKFLYFMDNTLAFSKKPKGSHKSLLYLQRVQTFSRGLVARIRALKVEEVRAAIAHDVEPFDKLLTDQEIDAMMARRDELMKYVDGLIAQYGEEKVLVFP